MLSLIYIGKYDELIPNRGYESMKLHFSESKYPNQDIISNYLNSGKVDMVSAELPFDVFTGDRIKKEKIGMNDGVYMWWNTLAHYVDKYNLRLPEEFENYILKGTLQ